MLDTIRSSTHGFVAKILLALVCLSFVIWGIGDFTSNPQRNRTLASVGGTEITTDQYMRAMHRETENIRRLMGDSYSPEALKGLNVEGYVMDNLINHRLLQLESVNLGLIPSDVDVVRRIRGNSAFQDSKGNFDRTIFESMLHNTNMTEKSYTDQLREDMGINILLDTLNAAQPDLEAAPATLLSAREEGRTISLYALNDSIVPAIPAPDDAAIKTYYNDHQREFTAPELREVSYITITAADVPQNARQNEDDLRAAYNEHIEEYKKPERREVSQLLYSSEDQAKQAEALMRTGKSVSEAAAKYPPLNKNAIAMGLIEKRNIFDNAADAVFSLKKGEISHPIQSPFGWHVFQVTAIQQPTVASFEDVRPALEKELQQRGNDEALNKLVNQVEDNLAGGASLQETASQFHLKLNTIGPVSNEGKDATGKKLSIPALDKFSETAFKTEEKTESPVMTSKGGMYYIVRVEKLLPEHLRPLGEVHDQAVKAWQTQQRAIKLAEIAVKAGQEFAGASAKTAVIAKYKLQPLGDGIIKRSTHVARDIPLPPQLVSDVFNRKPGEGTQAYLSNNGSYLLAVSQNVVPVAAPEKDARLAASLTTIRRNLETVKQNELIDEYTQYLRGKYAVKVNEDVFRAMMAN